MTEFKKIALGFATAVGLITGSAYLFAPTPPEMPHQEPLPMPQATVEEYAPPTDITEDYTPAVPVEENTQTTETSEVAPTPVETKPKEGWVKRTVRRFSKPKVEPKPKPVVVVHKKKTTHYTNVQYSKLPRIKKQNRIRANDNRTIFVEGINADFGRY
jgi:hypothetical protein